MYSIKDIIKKSFLEGFSASDISFKTVVLALLITAVIGFYIFLLYRIVTRKTFYSKNFNISLVGVAVITAAVILTIQSSVVVSLGMVGALSIVRFRTAIKDPMDLMFLFWSISTGIICGAGFGEYAVILALVLTALVFGLSVFPMVKAPMILVINASDMELEEKILEEVKKNAKCFSVKARNMTSTTLDMTIEIRTAEPSALIKSVMGIEGVLGASLLKQDGEVTF